MATWLRALDTQVQVNACTHTHSREKNMIENLELCIRII